MKDHPVIEIGTDQIELAPWNYKEDDAVKAVKLQNAMEKNGYIHKIAVAHRAEEPDNEKYEVVDGNHRLMAFREMKTESVLAIYVGKISIHARQKIGITLNEMKFESDPIKLAELMSDLSKEYSVEDLSLEMPYSQNQIEDMQKLLNFEWGDNDKGQTVDTAMPDDTKKTDWVEFKFGAIEANIPIAVYQKFGEACDLFVKHGVQNIVNQVEYMAVAAINELQPEPEAEEKEQS